MKRAGLILILLLAASPASGEPLADVAQIDAAVAEASNAFAVPERIIRAVMAQESARDPRAVSSAGAMGLMQIMPSTWRELQGRLGLGPDPFDVRDNVLAGAAYLRQMLDRFGPGGFLAAYDAGPARYASALAGRAPLPRETRNYVAALAPSVGASAAGEARRARARLAPQPAGLFVSLDGGRP
jgi:soluble lytic murein transglycosylase-like protein